MTLTATAPASESAYHEAGRRRVASVMAYAAGGFAFALVATILVFASNNFEFLPVRTTTVVAAYSAPIVVMIGVVYGIRSAALRQWVLAYIGLFGALGIPNAIISGFSLESISLPLLLAILFGLPSALLLALFNRRFRSVAPVLMIIAAMAAAGAAVASFVLIDPVLDVVVEVGVRLGLGGYTIFFLVCLIGLLAVGWLGLKVAQRLADAYRRKRLSEKRLIVDSIWLFESLIVAVSLDEFALLAALAFAAYKIVSVVGSRAALVMISRPVDGSSPRQPALLLLRVFATDARSQLLLDDLSSRWSYLGPIRLISAPDVARHSIDHNKVLLFLAGRLDELFLRNPEDLQKRLAALESGRDPDGRFRLEPFFCQGDIWRETVRQLIGATDITLMDLRGFDRTRKGCIYEIETLLDLVPLGRLLILVDDTTNSADLRHVLNSKWARLDPASPNLGLAAPQLTVLPVADPDHNDELADEVTAFADQALAATGP